MTPPTCDTCKHWKRYTSEEYGWGKEGKANPDDFGECRAVSFAFWERTGDRQFYVMDLSDCSATLTTRRDFGCNQHNVDLPDTSEAA
jgi:hypothetical protein